MNPQYRPDDSDFAAKLRIKITNESEDTNMKKHLSMLLVTLLVIMAFAAVAAARAELCPSCGNGSIRYSYGSIYTIPSTQLCEHVKVGSDEVLTSYRDYQTTCTNCGDTDTWTEVVGVNVICRAVDQYHID